MAKKDVRKIGKKMDKSKARKWVKDYQKKNPNGTHGWLYGSDILEALQNYDGCEGIWFFKGINDDGEERLVLFPADADGNILDKKMKSLGAAANLKNPGDDDPADDGDTCPPWCPNGV
ncbi:hypothetical protein SAMN05421640_0236 [Ekhidna lutea]|uniref:Uncharacterized protein n=1 Tax=Ekhidna lutea TaxID=447679 RepID=A0A239EMZ7_EKHLU|nr:hypothetical protein [Ekhidna lutea]SNS45929.1 hypothetical protein SAMN05421640_0236 [Ekhidna lutea]